MLEFKKDTGKAIITLILPLILLGIFIVWPILNALRTSFMNGYNLNGTVPRDISIVNQVEEEGRLIPLESIDPTTIQVAKNASGQYVLTFEGVEGASKYKVTTVDIRAGEIIKVYEGQNNFVLEFDEAVGRSQQRKCIIYVKALGDNVKYSDSADNDEKGVTKNLYEARLLSNDNVEFKGLGSVNNFGLLKEINGEDIKCKITHDVVVNATSYEYVLKDENNQVLENSITYVVNEATNTVTADLTVLPLGNYTISVVAKANEFTDSVTKEHSFVVDKDLDLPLLDISKDITIEKADDISGTILNVKHSEVANALGYEYEVVKVINGEEKKETKVVYTDKQIIIEDGGDYLLKIYSLGDNVNYDNSEAAILSFEVDVTMKSEDERYYYKGLGVENFTKIFTDDKFWESLKITLWMVLITVPLTIIIGLLVAIGLNSIKKLQGLYQVVFFLPYVTNTIAVGMIFNALFAKQTGFVNVLFNLDISWISSGATTASFLFVYTLYTIWNGLAFKVIVFLSGMQSIDKQYYQAAQIDSATKWQTFAKITVPLLSPMILYITITSFIGAFKAYSSVIALFGNGEYGPGSEPTLFRPIVGYIYDTLQDGYGIAVGQASAGSLILFAIILLITLVQFRVSKKRVHY